jgi:hypothetical protein
VKVYLRRGDRPIDLLSSDRRGQIRHGVFGNSIKAHLDEKKHPEIDQGSYTLTVSAADRGGTGSYTVRLPDLAKATPEPHAPPATNAPVASLTNAPQVTANATNRLLELRKQLKRLGEEIERTKDEIDRIEEKGKKSE